MRRVSAAVAVELGLAGGASLAGRLVDVSVVGLRMSAPSELALGTSCRVRLVASELQDVDARATVVRSGAGELALRFDDLPYESFERLRAFLLHHAEDPSALEDELSDRLGFLGDES